MTTTKKRKHRLIVDITLEEPCTAREALGELSHDLNRARLGSRIVREAVTVWEVKSFWRVHSALARASRNRLFNRMPTATANILREYI